MFKKTFVLLCFLCLLFLSSCSGNNIDSNLSSFDLTHSFVSDDHQKNENISQTYESFFSAEYYNSVYFEYSFDSSENIFSTEPEHIHIFSSATCISPGQCSCGETVGDMLGHLFSNATCTSPKTCDRCGITSGNELGHSYSNATCTSPKTCARCGITSGNELGHSYSNATCTLPKTCDRCGITSGNELGHSYSNATCTLPKTCSRCGNDDGTALGHNYVDNKCSRCQKIDPDSLPVPLSELYVIDCKSDFSSRYAFKESLMKDSFGNSYDKYYYFPSGGAPMYAIYNLKNSYSELYLDIVAMDSMHSSVVATIEIYVDGNLKYSKNTFTKTTGMQHVDINLEYGCQLEIRVLLTDCKGSKYARVAIVNAFLKK